MKNLIHTEIDSDKTLDVQILSDTDDLISKSDTTIQNNPALKESDKSSNFKKNIESNFEEIPKKKIMLLNNTDNIKAESSKNKKSKKSKI